MPVRQYLLLLSLGLAGCDVAAKCNLEMTSTIDGFRKYTCSGTLKSNGMNIKIPIESTDGSFLVAMNSTANIAVDELTDPQKEVLIHAVDWYQSANRYSNGILPVSPETVFNYPVQSDDTPVEEGTYTANIIAIDDEGFLLDDVDATVTVHVSDDTNFDQGTIPIRILFTQESATDSSIQNAMQSALTHARSFLTPLGVVPDYITETGDYLSQLDTVPDPISDTENTFIPLREVVEEGEVLLVVVDQINLNDTGTALHGIAGGIPGALTDGNRGIILVSWVSHAGGDASFSDSEIRLFGETIAHEMGHYLGLYHPIDDSEGVQENFDLYDNLADTPQCTTTAECEPLLGNNLMFPYPICFTNSCMPQDTLSREQVGILQRYTGVR